MRIYCIFREKQEDNISAEAPEVLKLTTYSDKAIILGGCQKEKEEQVMKNSTLVPKKKMIKKKKKKKEGNSMEKKVGA